MSDFRKDYKNVKFRLVYRGMSNWDLYEMSLHDVVLPQFASLAKPNSSATDSYFGDINHINRLKRLNKFNYEEVTK